MNTVTVSLPSASIARIVAAVANVQGVRFAGLTYRSKESGELARHTLILGASYENTVKQSIDLLTMRPDISADMTETRRLQSLVALHESGTKERKAANAVLKAFQEAIGADRAAASELCISLSDTLIAGATGGQNAAYTKAGLYEPICEGIKASRADGTLELWGLAHAKRVIEQGVYKVVNSSDKTLAKEAIRKGLPVGKFRTFALDEGAIESLRISGAEIDVS